MPLNPSDAASTMATAAPQGQGYKGTNLNIILDAPNRCGGDFLYDAAP
jgi:hypothetical protein